MKGKLVHEIQKRDTFQRVVMSRERKTSQTVEGKESDAITKSGDRQAEISQALSLFAA